MAQMIYSASALGIAMMFAVSMQSSSNTGEGAVYRNEVLTQLVTIGRDIVDEIARQDLPFDEQVDPNRIPQPATYPYVFFPVNLTPEAEFGNSGCYALNSCLDLDDFHSPDEPVIGEHNGLEYSATITVRYVNEADPNLPAPEEESGMSFAKEIVVTVAADAIQVNGEPIAAEYRRVTTYPRITNFSY
jgi:hypothetical protein